MKDWSVALQLISEATNKAIKASINPSLDNKKKMEEYAKQTNQYNKRAVFTIA